MAITAAQRSTALTLLIQNFGSPAVLGQLIPGLTPTALINAIAGAIGINFDTQLTTCLNNVVASLNAQVTSAQSGITSLQSQITADTVV